MKKISEVLGMNVLDSKGNYVGEIERAIYTRSRNRIAGFLLGNGRYFKSQALILYREIVSIGDDVIMVTQGAAMNPDSSLEMERAVNGKNDITDYRVYTDDGREIGTVKDVVFNEHGGLVEGYILAGDFVDDLLNGRKVLKLTDGAIVGEEAVILDSSSLDYSGLSNSGLISFLGLKDQ